MVRGGNSGRVRVIQACLATHGATHLLAYSSIVIINNTYSTILKNNTFPSLNQLHLRLPEWICVQEHYLCGEKMMKIVKRLKHIDIVKKIASMNL